MTLVTVFRHVPPPIIGTLGVIQDRAFEAFEERLDWLEAIFSSRESIPARHPPRWRLATLCESCFRRRATGAFR